MGRWSMVLSFWIVLSLFLMLFAAIGAILFVVSFICILLSIEMFVKHGRGFIFMGLSLPIVSKIVGNFLLLGSFWLLADYGLVGINPDAELPPHLVRRTAIVLIVLSALTLLDWFLFRNFFGVVPYDYYDYQIKENLTKKAINWRFTSIKTDKKEENEEEILIDNEE